MVQEITFTQDYILSKKLTHILFQNGAINPLAVFLQRQLWIVNYYVKSVSTNLSNESIKTSVSREMLLQK